MKAVEIEETSLQDCVSRTQEGRLIVTRKGQPVALVIGIDEEQFGTGARHIVLETDRKEARPEGDRPRGTEKVLAGAVEAKDGKPLPELLSDREFVNAMYKVA